jgi:hypothetical protein
LENGYTKKMQSLINTNFPIVFSVTGTKLIVVEFAIALGFAAVITQSLILSNSMIHFHQVFLNFYTNGTNDFSANVTTLVRNLGIVDLLTLIFGITIGAAITLTAANRAKQTEGPAESMAHLDKYERALVASGLVIVARNKEGTTYQMTEMGRRFLMEYADLRRKLEEQALPH